MTAADHLKKWVVNALNPRVDGGSGKSSNFFLPGIQRWAATQRSGNQTGSARDSHYRSGCGLFRTALWLYGDPNCVACGLRAVKHAPGRGS